MPSHLRELFCVSAIVLAFDVLAPSATAWAQTGREVTTSSSVAPSGGGAALLDPDDAVFLFLDHQSGLFLTVKDVPVADLRRNV